MGGGGGSGGGSSIGGSRLGGASASAAAAAGATKGKRRSGFLQREGAGGLGGFPAVRHRSEMGLVKLGGTPTAAATAAAAVTATNW